MEAAQSIHPHHDVGASVLNGAGHFNPERRSNHRQAIAKGAKPIVGSRASGMGMVQTVDTAAGSLGLDSTMQLVALGVLTLGAIWAFRRL